jgi:nitrate/nitrite transport system substrate-binding protein
MTIQQWDEHKHAPSTSEGCLDRAIETAVERAIFGGHEMARRRFFQLVGASSAAALIRTVFPLDTAKALAQEHVKGIEKKDLTVAFIPITCATPIIMANPWVFMPNMD